MGVDPLKKKPFPCAALERLARGDEAIRALVGRLTEVAVGYGIRPWDFARMLRRDRHLWSDHTGRLFHVADFEPPPSAASGGAAAAGRGTASTIPLDLVGNPACFSNTALERIQPIWRRQAKDSAPFDADVTTEELQKEAMARRAAGPRGQRVRRLERLRQC